MPEKCRYFQFVSAAHLIFDFNFSTDKTFARLRNLLARLVGEVTINLYETECGLYILTRCFSCTDALEV